MFEAFVFVCAANLSYEIDYNTCIRLSDDWGPYVSQENCDIRSNQMVESVLRGELNPVIFQMYENLSIQVDQIYALGMCKEIPGVDI